MTRLMRNQRDGLGKYRVWNNRKQTWVENDGPRGENEHFCLMLKDEFSRVALMAYAAAARDAGLDEYSKDVMELANRSGPMHPNCKRPD